MTTRGSCTPTLCGRDTGWGGVILDQPLQSVACRFCYALIPDGPHHSYNCIRTQLHCSQRQADVDRRRLSAAEAIVKLKIHQLRRT